MIYVRDDDVLMPSSSHPDPLKHFKTVHEWICETPKLLHIPTIVVRPLSEMSEAVAYIKEQTKLYKMSPQVHGYEHIDYAKLTVQEIKDHLMKCKDFLFDEFDVIPSKWYTPWGANAPHLYEAADETGLTLIDCSRIYKMNGRYGIIQLAKEGKDIEKFLHKKEIFFHWWEGGMRLKRVIEIVKHGSYEAAKTANGNWF